MVWTAQAQPQETQDRNVGESLDHTKWECKYHVIFIPKYRRQVLYGTLRLHLGKGFRELA